MNHKILLFLGLILLAGCRTTGTVGETAETTADSSGTVTRDSIIYIADTWRADSLNTNTVLTVVLNLDGDTIRTDKVSTSIKTTTKTVRLTVNKTSYRDRWRNINHRYYRTITKTVKEEPGIWQRIQIGGFWLLLADMAIIIVILRLKNKFI